jgi:hypothetical protein
MPSPIVPDSKEPFSDSEGNPRNAAVFRRQGTIKGTVMFFLGGHKREGGKTSFLRIHTNGLSHANADEYKFIKEMRDLGWRMVVLEESQDVKPDGKINEYWIEEYINHWNSKWPGKNFTVGHSAGAYITGLHIRHLHDKKTRSVWANGIISYPIKLGDAKKKTDFASEHFTARNTIFLSGKQADDEVLPYRNTIELRNIAFASGHRHGWEALDASHQVFKKACCSQGCGGKRAVTLILDDWFTRYPKLPKLPRSECAVSIPGTTNPAGS